jgi:hypothetical protein
MAEPGGRVEAAAIGAKREYEMQIDISKSWGWSLAIAGLVLLATSGKLNWLVILVPASLVLGYGLMRVSKDRNKLTSTMKKR